MHMRPMLAVACHTTILEFPPWTMHYIAKCFSPPDKIWRIQSSLSIKPHCHAR